MGHPRPLVFSEWTPWQAAGYHHHPGSSQEPRISDLLACPRIWIVRGQSPGDEGAQRRNPGIELRPRSRRQRYVSLPHSDPIGTGVGRTRRKAVSGIYWRVQIAIGNWLLPKSRAKARDRYKSDEL